MGKTMVSPSVDWVHAYPASIWQIEEQPSPLMALPSSHCSLATAKPSPHVVLQPPPAAGQFGSAAHRGVQPSPKSLFWGIESQPSEPLTMPSPQPGTAVVPPVEDWPAAALPPVAALPPPVVLPATFAIPPLGDAPPLLKKPPVDDAPLMDDTPPLPDVPPRDDAPPLFGVPPPGDVPPVLVLPPLKLLVPAVLDAPATFAEPPVALPQSQGPHMVPLLLHA